VQINRQTNSGENSTLMTAVDVDNCTEQVHKWSISKAPWSFRCKWISDARL